MFMLNVKCVYIINYIRSKNKNLFLFYTFILAPQKCIFIPFSYLCLTLLSLLLLLAWTLFSLNVLPYKKACFSFSVVVVFPHLGLLELCAVLVEINRRPDGVQLYKLLNH